MNRKPLKGLEYDNFDLLIKQRLDTWKYRMLREEYLLKVYKKVFKDCKLTKVTHLADAFSPPEQTTTAIIVRWRLYYPYVAGDDEYNDAAEEKARETYCDIFVNINGDEPSEFKATIHFDYKGEDGELNSVYHFEANEFDTETVIVPRWFTLYLNRINQSNSKYLN